MKLPNGYGSVYKLSGNRRKPWAVRITCGWEINPETKKEKRIVKFIGYYETRKEALLALADYNSNPYDLNKSKITFQEVYERWSDEHFPTISNSNISGYKAVLPLCSSFANRRIVDITLDDLQRAADESGKNSPTLQKYKGLVNLVYKYAVIHSIVPKERNMVEYLNIKKAGNPNKIDREIFSKTEISRLWDMKDRNVHYTIILMLIYTGVRISEFLDLKKENIFLEERRFNVVESKTQAGIRTVPIAEKIVPFFTYWLNLNDSEYLLSTPEGNHFKYRNFYDSYWKPLIKALDMSHRPHDARHTCISLLASAKIDERIIKKIVGHQGQGVTEAVYTHFEIMELQDAINKI